MPATTGPRPTLINLTGKPVNLSIDGACIVIEPAQVVALTTPTQTVLGHLTQFHLDAVGNRTPLDVNCHIPMIHENLIADYISNNEMPYDSNRLYIVADDVRRAFYWRADVITPDEYTAIRDKDDNVTAYVQFVVNTYPPEDQV